MHVLVARTLQPERKSASQSSPPSPIQVRKHLSSVSAGGSAFGRVGSPGLFKSGPCSRYTMQREATSAMQMMIALSRKKSGQSQTGRQVPPICSDAPKPVELNSSVSALLLACSTAAPGMTTASVTATKRTAMTRRCVERDSSPITDRRGKPPAAAAAAAAADRETRETRVGTDAGRRINGL